MTPRDGRLGIGAASPGYVGGPVTPPIGLVAAAWLAADGKKISQATKAVF